MFEKLLWKTAELVAFRHRIQAADIGSFDGYPVLSLFEGVKETPRLGPIKRSLVLALGYSLFWMGIHYFFTTQAFGPSWAPIQLVSSLLIFFTLNGLFASFDYYRWGKWAQLGVAFLYIQPFFQLFYYRTYRSFLDQQNISLIIREPFFLVKVFATETTWDKGLILILGILFFWFLNRWALRRHRLTQRHLKPYDFFANKWSLLFTAVMIGLQIKWCLHHDTSQLAMRPFYPITFMALLSIIIYLVRTHSPPWERLFVLFLIFVNIGQLYTLNLGFVDERGRFTLDAQFFRSLFGAFYVQAAFGDMQQDDHARARFHALPEAKIDYNIFISLNDAQRWDHLSSHGYPRPTDDELKWFYEKSFDFQYPIAPANFTDTSVPALLYGLASDQDVRRMKGSLAVWDYFAKSADTFFVSSQDITWSKLNLFYASVGQEYVWSATAQPGYKGNPEDTNDILSFQHLKEYLPKLQKPWVGVWQTFASHSPYTVNPEFVRYQPCDLSRNSGVENFRNCYLNAQVYSTWLRSELFKTFDLGKTVIVLTSDHGEGMGEHGVFFHGVDYHQEMVKVPFTLYIPPPMLERLPKEAVENLKANTHKITSTTDLVPTLLHLHEMLTGQKLHEDLSQFSGRSLFTKWDHRVVFSSHCFPQYRCYSREIMFADDDYYVLFRPSEGFFKIYDTWKDMSQEHPLNWDHIDKSKFEKLVEEAARIHPFGNSMKAYYERFKANDYKAF